MSTPARDPVSVILPILPGRFSPASISTWVSGLNSLGHPWELLVVPDGVVLSPVPWPPHQNRVRLISSHPTPRGYGACIRTGLAAASHELVATASLDYPYSPADLKRLIDRIQTPSELEDPDTGEIVLRTPDLVSGCRTGVPVPALAATVGTAYRWFCRLALGLPQHKLPGWYGFGEHLRAWRAWLVYGVPFEDPNSALKVFRKAAVARFPIQSDGEFVHVEIAAKCTFLNGILDEVPLAPSATPVPRTVWDYADRKRVFGSPKFWQPTGEAIPRSEPTPGV